MVNRGAGRVLAVAVISAVVLGGCSSTVDRTGGETTVEPTVLNGINTRSSLEMQDFTDELAALSGGSLVLDWESGWHKDSVTGEAEAIEAVRSGEADYAVVPVRAWHGAGVSSFDALIAPMAVDSYPLQDAVLQDGMVDEMLSGVGKLDLVGIGVLPGPIRMPAGITRELLAPADFQGVTIAISPGEVPDRSLRALGATPVPSPFEGADMASFDGAELQVGSVSGNGYDGVVKTVTSNVNLWPRPYVIVGNAKAVEKLSDDQLAMLKKAAVNAVPETSAEQVKSQIDGVNILCRRGKAHLISASTDESAQLRDAFAPVNEWLAQDVQTAGFLQRIDELRAGLGPQTEPEISCPGAAAPSTGLAASVDSTATPVDGTYEMITTDDDLAAFGQPESEREGNFGTFRWVLDKGRFTETQDDGETEWWATGTYEVDGPNLTISYLDSGATGPGSHTSRQPGEVDTWTWSLYRDQLTIKWIDPTLPPSNYPSNYVVKPWTRLGDASEITATPTG